MNSSDFSFEQYTGSFPSLQAENVRYAFITHIEDLFWVIDDIKNDANCKASNEVSELVILLETALKNPSPSFTFFKGLEEIINKLIRIIDDIYERNWASIPRKLLELHDDYEWILQTLRGWVAQSASDILWNN